jgi:cell wall-associated NlpC family hydrolase
VIHVRKILVIVLIPILLATVLAACTVQKSTIHTKTVRNEVTIPVIKNQSGRYVSLKKLAGVMGYQVAWSEDGKWMDLGGNDVQYRIAKNEPKGMIGDQVRTLTKAPIAEKDDLLIPDSTVSEMFQSELKYFVRDHEMTLYAFPELMPRGKAFQFKDAPSAATSDHQAVFNSFPSPIAATEAGLPHVPITKMISLAQGFIGVPYLFGAKSFDVTKRFDCSSFTQYVYAKEGLNLPRSSRDQANQGIAVSRQMLKPGDLMFFYVPGRFRSNSIIGHVGLYIGNGQMIHATPSAPSGVKITSINNSYWQQKFLSARRVASAM